MSFESYTNKFFGEWQDTRQNTIFWAAALFFIFILLLGVYVNFPEQQTTTSIFIFMLLFCAIGAAIDRIKESNYFVANVLVGKWKYYGLIPIVIGLVFGFLMVSKSWLSIKAPLAITAGTWSFIYIVLIAPVVEEWTFRWTITPTIIQYFKGFKLPFYGVLGMIIANVMFAAFHGYAYGWNIAAMQVAFIVGVVYTIGNYTLKSGGFSLGAHLANNFLVYSLLMA